MKRIIIIVLVLLGVSSVMAQPPYHCGTTFNVSVINDRVDAGGFAPRFVGGDRQQFDCIAARDPYFYSQRFKDYYLSANHWLGLLSQEIGQPVGQIPAPPSN